MRDSTSYILITYHRPSYEGQARYAFVSRCAHYTINRFKRFIFLLLFPPQAVLTYHAILPELEYLPSQHFQVSKEFQY